MVTNEYQGNKGITEQIKNLKSFKRVNLSKGKDTKLWVYGMVYSKIARLQKVCASLPYYPSDSRVFYYNTEVFQGCSFLYCLGIYILGRQYKCN